MKCSEFERLVVLVEEEELAGQEREDLREHARTCPRCAEFARDMQRVAILLRRERPAAPPAGFAQRVMARIRLVQATGQAEGRRQRGAWG